jgi:peptide/nickel transport system ATP-binding protein
MYAGRVVEEATVEALFADPRHPYTQGLIRSIPRIDMAATHKVRLEAIAGTVPKLVAPVSGGLPVGCRFAARCKHVTPACTTATPPLREISPGHKVACILDITAT